MGTFGKQPEGCRGTESVSVQTDYQSRLTRERRRLSAEFLLHGVSAALLLVFQVSAFAAETTNPAPSSGSSSSSEGGTNGLGEFQLKRGFRIELVVSEPMVTAPVAMAFDENGR